MIVPAAARPRTSTTAPSLTAPSARIEDCVGGVDQDALNFELLRRRERGDHAYESAHWRCR